MYSAEATARRIRWYS